jgi:hypothetical protein
VTVECGGGLSCGLLVGAAGPPVLALTGGVLAFAILPVAVTTYRRRACSTLRCEAVVCAFGFSLIL